MVEADAKLVFILIRSHQKLLAILDNDSDKTEFLPTKMTVVVAPDHLVYKVVHAGEFVTVMQRTLDRNVFAHEESIAETSVTAAFFGAIEFF